MHLNFITGNFYYNIQWCRILSINHIMSTFPPKQKEQIWTNDPGLWSVIRWKERITNHTFCKSFLQCQDSIESRSIRRLELNEWSVASVQARILQGEGATPEKNASWFFHAKFNSVKVISVYSYVWFSIIPINYDESVFIHLNWGHFGGR